MDNSTVLKTECNRKGILEYKEKHTGISMQIFTERIGSWLYHDLTVYLFPVFLMKPYYLSVR